MKNKTVPNPFDDGVNHHEKLFRFENTVYPRITPIKSKQNSIQEHTNDLAEILFITPYPPRVCGIATYSQDLIKVLNNKFSSSLSIKVCALENVKWTGLSRPILLFF